MSVGRGGGDDLLAAVYEVYGPVGQADGGGSGRRQRVDAHRREVSFLMLDGPRRIGGQRYGDRVKLGSIPVHAVQPRIAGGDCLRSQQDVARHSVEGRGGSAQQVARPVVDRVEVGVGRYDGDAFDIAEAERVARDVAGSVDCVESVICLVADQDLAVV